MLKFDAESRMKLYTPSGVATYDSATHGNPFVKTDLCGRCVASRFGEMTTIFDTGTFLPVLFSIVVMGWR